MLAAAAFFIVAARAPAQTAASMSMGGSIVQYEGFLTSAAATLTPAVQYDARNLSLGGQASWTVFESGNQILQVNGAAGWLSPQRDSWRFELSGAAGVSRYAQQTAASHVLARSRLHFLQPRYGTWLSAATGATVDSSTFVPVEVAVGVWTVREPLSLMASVTAVWIDTESQTDIAATARWTRGRMELEARAGVRDAIGWGELAGSLPLTTQISFSISGGSYPTDRVRRVLGATYVAAGLRIGLNRAERMSLSTLPAELAAARRRTLNPGGAQPRLEISAAGEDRVLRIHAAGAASVEVMGDFTDWNPLRLTGAGNGIWEARLQLPAGVHRLNVRIDGGEWVVPAGVRAEADDFGTVVGVIVVR